MRFCSGFFSCFWIAESRFYFAGFFLKKGRQTKLKQLCRRKKNHYFYESPHKINTTFEQIKEFLEKHKVSLPRNFKKNLKKPNMEQSMSSLTFLKVKTLKENCFDCE